MVDTTTPNLGLVKPEINGEQTENVWGYDLNANFDKLDAFAGAVDVLADAPVDGVIYGRLNEDWAPTVLKTDFNLLATAVIGKAPLDSPAFVGNPTAPTPSTADNDTTLATTGFVKAVAFAAGVVAPSDALPLPDGTAAPGASALYSRADHVHPQGVLNDPTKVLKSGDTMTGALTINSGGMWLFGWGGNVGVGVIFFDNSGTTYLHQTGSAFTFVGKPVNVSSATASTTAGTGALVVVGGAGIGGRLNVGSAGSFGSFGSFGDSIRIPVSTGIGWGQFPFIAGTPQFIYNAGLFQFGLAGDTPVLVMDPASKASTFGGGIGMPAGQTLNFGNQAYVYGVVNTLIAAGNLINFTNYAGTSFAQLDANGCHIYATTAASPGGTTGALTVAGGLGVVGASYFANDLRAGIDLYAGRTVYAGGADGTWAFGYPLSVGVKWAGGSGANYGIGCRPVTDSPYATAIAFLRADATAFVGSIAQSPTSTAYGTTSDGRLKKDRKGINSGHIIDRLETYDFLWAGTEERGFGVIAQDAAEVVPQACFHHEDVDQWMTDYSKFVPILLAEMKALRARVAELEGRA